MELWHSERGGLKKGKSFLMSLNFSWPFAKIEVYREMIVIKYFFGRLKFEKNEISSVEQFKVGFAKWIKINHNKTNASHYIAFLPFSAENLLTKIEEAGYKVKS